MPQAKTIVVGLGNPILGDDAVGWKAAELVRMDAAKLGAEVKTLSLGGLRLMEELIGYDRAVIIDAVCYDNLPLGSVRTFPLESLENPFAGHLGSTHETNLQSALEMGRLLGQHLPGEVMVVAISTAPSIDFSETLSPAAAGALPAALQKVLELLSAWA